MRYRCLQRVRLRMMVRQRLRLRMLVRDMKGCRMVEWVHWIRGIIVGRRVWRNRTFRGALQTVGMMRIGSWCRGM